MFACLRVPEVGGVDVAGNTVPAVLHYRAARVGEGAPRTGGHSHADGMLVGVRQTGREVANIPAYSKRMS